MQNINFFSDSENETNELSSYHELLLFPIVLILLFVSIFLNVYFFVNNKKTIEHLTTEYKQNISQITDSLTTELEFTKTLIEIKTIHEIYGRISMSKEKIGKPTTNEVWDFIQTLDAWYPEYIIAQAIIESGCGTLMPQNSNNMFGMTVPKTRESVAININTSDKYAKYNNWKESVIDRVLWELHIFKCIKPSEDQYIARFTKYATSPTYVSSVQSIAKQYKK